MQRGYQGIKHIFLHQVLGGSPGGDTNLEDGTSLRLMGMELRRDLEARLSFLNL